MERNIDMKEVSDGRLYTSNDLVKADCGGCEGCSACCQGMGESIVLDPLDIHRLCCGLHTDFNGLMVDKIELQIDPAKSENGIRKYRSLFVSEPGRTLQHPCISAGHLPTVPTGKIL